MVKGSGKGKFSVAAPPFLQRLSVQSLSKKTIQQPAP